MKPTFEQQPIIDFKGLHLVVKAYAGCGKTATLQAFASSNSNLRILYLAYNRAIRDEAMSKFPDNVTCKTGHQLAWPKFGSRYAHKLGNTKMTDVARLLNTKDWGFVRNTMAVVSSYMSSADAEIGIAHFYAGVPAEDQDAFSDSDIEKLLNAAQTLWEEMTDIESTFICEHDAYLKLYQLSGPELSYDCILFDEAQDANPVVSAIVASQPGQKIFVGDPWQQIYRWRGAENALDEQIDQGATPMYLTNSFRFGPMIAGVANTILRLQGETRPLVGLGPMDKVRKTMDGIRGRYTVLNRTVSGVIMTAIDAVSSGRVVYWNGGLEAYNLSGLEDTYNLKNNRMTLISDKRVKAFKNYDSYVEAAEASEDPEMLRTMRILKDHSDIPRLLRALREYSTDDIDQADIVVSTTHRAKGLEWDVVKLEEDFPDIFDPEKVDPDQVGDELNLLYVGVTRARKILVLNTLVQTIILRAHRALQLSKASDKEASQ